MSKEKVVWQGVSRFYWEYLQTFAGGSYSQVKNTFGQVDRVDFFGGATFATNENDSRRNIGNGVSIGSFININLAGEIDQDFDNYILQDPLFMHEYGHYVQSQIFGLSYLFAVGLPSLHSALTSTPEEHHRRRYERQANRYASRYFRRNFGVEWDENENPF